MSKYDTRRRVWCNELEALYSTLQHTIYRFGDAIASSLLKSTDLAAKYWASGKITHEVYINLVRYNSIYRLYTGAIADPANGEYTAPFIGEK